MLQRFRKDMIRYWPYVAANAKARLKAEVAGSYLNWLWWIINPLSFMLIYTFIFGVVFHAAEPYFPLYVFIGLTVWDFFSHVLVQSVQSVKNNRFILSSVYLPKYMLTVADMLINGFKLLVSFGIVALMMLFYRVPLGWNTLLVLPALLGLALFTFGLSNLMLHAGVYVRDLVSVINIALRLLFYLTGIFYDIEKRLPPPFHKLVLRFNPMAVFITQTRDALLFRQSAHTRLLLLWIGLSALLAAASIRVIYAHENDYVKVI